MKVKWLDRRIAVPGPYLCLCLSDAEYREAMKKIKLNGYEHWIHEHANATTHFSRIVPGMVAVVCLNAEERSPVEIAGLLVHEAVHVWQEWCDYYGERNPAVEQEAYAIQAISQELMAEYARRLMEKKS